MPVAVAALAGVAFVGGSSLWVEHQVRSAKKRLDAPP